jgi:KDO2-lipid IV(A) lauroyltransferase
MGHATGMQDVLYRLQALSLRGLLALVSILPMGARRAVLGAVTGALVRFSPLGRRARDNLHLIWPDRPEAERRAIARAAGRNVGRTLTGIWFNDDLDAEFADLLPEPGLGLDALRTSRAAGKGAIVVSGHFGQWEAIRHALRRSGLETGALYRPNNNPYYEPIFRAGIEKGGAPIVPKGRAGMRALLRHLRGGGIMAILIDQHVGDGVRLPFLGVPAKTSLSAAELALRHGVPLVPAFAPWEDGRPRIVLEAPIPPSDPETMTREFNDRLSAWVARHPSQWHWLHRRWKTQTDPGR